MWQRLKKINEVEIQTKGGRIQLEHKQAIRDLVRRNMIGTEIVESTPESITIQILTSLPEQDKIRHG